jgi:hypothetical protein
MKQLALTVLLTVAWCQMPLRAEGITVRDGIVRRTVEAKPSLPQTSNADHCGDGGGHACLYPAPPEISRAARKRFGRIMLDNYVSVTPPNAPYRSYWTMVIEVKKQKYQYLACRFRIKPEIKFYACDGFDGD